jgi:hypothetical protein
MLNASSDASGLARTAVNTGVRLRTGQFRAADPAALAPSLLAYIGHPAYGLDALRADLDRFAFLLGGNDGEFLLGEDPA